MFRPFFTVLVIFMFINIVKNAFLYTGGQYAQDRVHKQQAL